MSAPELDFDELDKAINTVLSDKEVQQEAASISAPRASAMQPAAPTPTDQRSTTVIEPKSAPPPMPASRDRVQGRPSAAPTPSVAPRKPVEHASTPAFRRGVIDIMSPPSKRPSRQAATVQPVRDVQVPSGQQPSSQPAAEQAKSPQPTLSPEERALRWPPRENEPKPEDKPTAGQVQQESHQAFETHNEPQGGHKGEDSFERFDTLSRSGFDFETDGSKDIENPPPKSEQPAPVSVPVDTAQDEQKTTQPSPVSPFLTDAKVEKRPLGGYGPAPTPESEKSQPDKTKEPASQPSASQGMPTDPLLEAHYDDEPVSVIEPTAEKPVTIETVPENAHTGVKLDHLLDDGSEHNQPASVKPEAASTPLSMQSIPQQYKVTEPKSSDQSRPIFDTNEYHAPLDSSPVAKKSSKGMWITLAIIILLAVAGGLFIYFYGSQLGL